MKDAVRTGCRHNDTAQSYGNEEGVGEGVRSCGVERGQMFATTKLEAGIKAYDETVVAIDHSLKKMQLDYIDLMIIHSPQPWSPRTS